MQPVQHVRVTGSMAAVCSVVAGVPDYFDFTGSKANVCSVVAGASTNFDFTGSKETVCSTVAGASDNFDVMGLKTAQISSQESSDYFASKSFSSSSKIESN